MKEPRGNRVEGLGTGPAAEDPSPQDLNIIAIIPAYNEIENLEELNSRLVAALDANVGAFQVLYVYQGDDGGGRVLRAMEKEDPRITAHLHPRPLGVGGAFRLGFEAVDGQCTHVLTMDADLNHEPEALPSFLAKTSKADVVVGSRYVPGGGWEELRLWKKLVSPLANHVVARAFRMGVSDLSSGYRLYRREVVEAITPELSFGGYEFYPESLIWAARKGFRIAEVPIVYRKRIHGRSKIKPLAAGLGYARLLMTLRRSRGGAAPQ